MIERIDELDKATTRKMRNIAEGLSKKLDKYIRNKHDTNLLKATNDVIMKKHPTTEKQMCMNWQIINFHKTFSRSQNRAILEGCIVEKIAEYFCSLCNKNSEIH